MIATTVNALLTKLATGAAERGQVPDAAIRWAIRRLLRQRLAQAAARGEGGDHLATQMRKLPIAVEQELANEQHYEVPHAFFEQVLGPRLKYSSCLFEEGSQDLARAEERMLALTCERGRLEDGMRVLDIGCGWGSLSLWIAEHYPACRVVSVSNSHGQRRAIETYAAQRGLQNLQVVTADISHFDASEHLAGAGGFDRAFSVEMFEHMRNWEQLFARIAGWLEADGYFLMHYFCHHDYGYLYEDEGSGDWMARHFFSGGIMPCEKLPEAFDRDLRVVERWRVGGLHYSKTLEAWLDRIDAAPAVCEAVLGTGANASGVELQRWRMFMMACSELFAHEGGDEWFVAHALLQPRSEGPG